MMINPFLAGVLTVLFVEAAAFIVWSIAYTVKQQRKGK